MSNLTTENLTPEAFKKWDRDTSVKVGQVWLRIPNEHAGKLRVGEAADITYDEWVGRNGKTNYTIVAVNGQDVKRQQQQRSGGLGGQQQKGKLGQQQAKADSGRRSDWDLMGPENRARFAAKDLMARRYGNPNLDLPDAHALAAEFSIIFHGWLQGCEGRNPHAGNAGGNLDEALDGDHIPDNYAGPGEDDYVE